MKFLVAPDKFKGTHTASEVAKAVCRGVEDAGQTAVRLPVADGGEGTALALLEARGGSWRECETTDPLERRIKARYAMLVGEDTAVIDVAEASGLWRLQAGQLDPLVATTRGTGILIASAVEAGATEVILAPGGSATNDAGQGLLEVLEERSLSPEIRVVCDVETRFADATREFGPQKGASAAQLIELETRLDEFAENAPRDPRNVPMSGCGGGLSGGLWAYHDAELVPGAEFVLGEIGFDQALETADVVITGEGRIDSQTFLGKAVGVVAAHASVLGKPCHAIVGARDFTELERKEMGLTSISQGSTLAEVRQAARDLAGSVGESRRKSGQGPSEGYGGS